jgi:hypothetical protein
VAAIMAECSPANSFCSACATRNYNNDKRAIRRQTTRNGAGMDSVPAKRMVRSSSSM